MLNVRSIIGNFSVALVAQGVNLCAGIFISLVLPKILGVTEFGFWQLFILMSNYVGFFHLGLNDGVYLIEGGKSRDQIDKTKIKSQFLFGALYQLVASVLVVVVLLFLPMEGARKAVYLAAAVFLLVNNLSLFWGYVFQAMNETKKFSCSIVVDRGLFLIAMFVLIFAGVTDFLVYVVAYIASKSIALAYCVYYARDFFSSRSLSIADAATASIEAVKVGIKLMIASYCGILILGLTQFYVDFAWDIDTFSKYSFALSMVSFFMIFVAQASMVLFPALRQAGSDEQVKAFVAFRDALDLLLPAVFVLYCPAVFVLTLWLPQYAESFALLALLLPICVFDGKMDLVGTTYLKVIRKESALLKINVLTLSLCALSVAINYVFFQSLELLSVMTVFVVAARSLLAERLIENCFEVKHSRLSFVPLLLAAIFMGLAEMTTPVVCMVTYGVAYTLFLFANRKTAQSLARSILSAVR